MDNFINAIESRADKARSAGLLVNVEGFRYGEPEPNMDAADIFVGHPQSNTVRVVSITEMTPPLDHPICYRFTFGISFDGGKTIDKSKPPAYCFAYSQVDFDKNVDLIFA